MIENKQIDWASLQQGIEQEGFFIVRSFLDINSFDENDLRKLQIAERNYSGTIQQVPENICVFLTSLFRPLLVAFRKNLDLRLADELSFCAIRVQKNNGNRRLNLPFNYHSDPVIDPSGALNWHLDHYSYFVHRDHKNYLICYIPIVKIDPKLSNVALIPKSLLRQKDPISAKKVSQRGACRFRKVEDDTIDWFKKRFPNEEITIEDWYAIDDFKDSSPGWRCNIDLEKEKVVPHLNVGDLLIMTADLIHKTNDTGINRIAVRCDIQPASVLRKFPTLWRIFMKLRMSFGSRKAAYNLRKIY